MSDFGMIVTLPGYDADDPALAPENCAVHSDYPSPKVRCDKTPAHFDLLDYTFTNDPADGRHNLFTVAHGYSFIPKAWVFTKDFRLSPAGFYQLPVNIGLDLGFQYLEYYTDGTNLKIDYVRLPGAFFGYNDVTGYQFQFKYYIFGDEAG